MVPNVPSRATEPNDRIKYKRRTVRQDNTQWVAAYLGRRALTGPVILLFGGIDELGYRLRTAQCHVRSDMTPSPWSHAALLGEFDGRSPGRSALIESPLDPLTGHGWAPRMNAVRVDTPLSRYADPEFFPNIAVLCLPNIDRKLLSDALQAFVRERGVIDCCELVLRWLAYAWGTASAPNPLFEGLGLPSAVTLTHLLARAGYDLAPGIAGVAATPESVWQSARWWHEHHERESQAPVFGQWHIEHSLASYQSYRHEPARRDNVPTIEQTRNRVRLPELKYIR